MEMQQQEQRELQIRELLLDFYASELTTHSRLIIGFSVILLTILQIAHSLRTGGSVSWAQSTILLLGIFFTAFALWFLLLRHFVYGILANSATHALPSENQEENLLARMIDGVKRDALEKKILGFIPTCLFYSTDERISLLQRLFSVEGTRMFGVLLCAYLALITTYFLKILIG